MMGWNNSGVPPKEKIIRSSCFKALQLFIGEITGCLTTKQNY